MSPTEYQYYNSSKMPRLSVAIQIRGATEQLPAWFPLAMDLALATGQRRKRKRVLHAV